MNQSKLKLLVVLIVCALAEAPDGIPSGHLYAALMGHGIDLATHETLVGIAVQAGWATKKNHLLRATEAGRAIADKVKPALVAPKM